MKYFLLPLYFCFLFGEEQPQYIDGVAAVVEEHIILKSDLAQMVNMAAVQSGIDPSKDQSSFLRLQNSVLQSMVDQKILLEMADIDSITVGKLESTINLSSPDTDIGQYGKVYLSYTLTSNPNIPNSGTWIGYGRGISPDGVLSRGDLMGVWTMDGTKINIKSVDSVTDGINFLSGTIDLIAGEAVAEVFKVE